jgi:hypothetical protein
VILPVSERAFKPLRFRQVHLDFHTSEAIGGVGAAFDAEQFVSTLSAAHVDSVTLFARCHHGWCYYPTAIGAAHPGLVRPDLLGEMIAACRTADIETPIYISVQWDERMARLHPEWRAMSATNADVPPAERHLSDQMRATWHTLCLTHRAYRDFLLAHALEVAERYQPPGLFFDIMFENDCVCPACLDRMVEQGLDPSSPADRRRNDRAVIDAFRAEMSAALWSRWPGMRIFYNASHIGKGETERYKPYSHLELESLPTGGWGYDHFPSSARYATTLGVDFLGMTGKFHTSWGEFGGFKTFDALDYECAHMVALGAKCSVGDQLHPSGAINADTYRLIGHAYGRIAALEPYLRDARHMVEIAIVSAEQFAGGDAERNHGSDDGAARMLLELHHPFDIIDTTDDLARYKCLILPDAVPVDAALAARLEAFRQQGGCLVLSGRSGLDPRTGDFSLDLGVSRGTGPLSWDPSYAQVTEEWRGAGLPTTPFVVYGAAEAVVAGAAHTLAVVRAPYFNRSFQHFSSHQHAPEDPSRPPVGAAVTLHKGVGYIAFPIFRLYKEIGQPLYKAMLRGLLDRLLGAPLIEVDLPSSGRVWLTRQQTERRHVLHLLYAAPQLRGDAVPGGGGSMRAIEVIEDIPVLGPIRVVLRLPASPRRAYLAVSGEPVAIEALADGRYGLKVPGLRIHEAVILED